MDESEPDLPADAPPPPPADRPVEDPTWYYRLNLLAAATLAVLLFCLIWRPTAWIGLGVTVLSLGALFFYYYFNRAQLGLVEFMVTIAVLSQVTGLTLNVLWPQLRDTDKDWMILAAWIMEAAWILCGSLWSSWVARTTRLSRTRERLYVMVVAWLTVPAVPGLLVSAGLCLVGIPTWLVHTIQQQPDCVFSWHVCLAPIGLLVSAWALNTARGLHLTAHHAETQAQEQQEKFNLPRDYTMGLREKTTPEDLPFEEDPSPDTTSSTPPEPQRPPGS